MQCLSQTHPLTQLITKQSGKGANIYIFLRIMLHHIGLEIKHGHYQNKDHRSILLIPPLLLVGSEI